MSDTTVIEWTATRLPDGTVLPGYTFNPWTGCTKISPACDNCYAESWAKRSGLVKWGAHEARRRTSAANWEKPLKWNRQAGEAGIRRKVFCASLADVFDNHRSIQPAWRDDLWALIRATPHLDWLLLTKRPGNISRMLPPDWGDGYPNVWLGCTIANQEEADRDIPKLLAIPAAIRFISAEPLLGPVDLGRWLATANVTCKECRQSFWLHEADPCEHAKWGSWTLACPNCGGCRCSPGAGKSPFPRIPEDWLRKKVGRFEHVHPTIAIASKIDWVIVGGESGPHARPMHPDWARFLRDQCQAAGVAFFFKQWGEWLPGAFGPPPALEWQGNGPIWDANQFPADMDHEPKWDDGLHYIDEDEHAFFYRTGKKAAGRLLDGREWNEVPG